MNETQKLIKSVIEDQTKKLYGIEVIVDYVSDVSARILELQQSGANLNSVYDAEYCTGAFIPAVNDNPYYILIQKDRKTKLDVMTAFHEFKHLIDYVMF